MEGFKLDDQQFNNEPKSKPAQAAVKQHTAEPVGVKPKSPKKPKERKNLVKIVVIALIIIVVGVLAAFGVSQYLENQRLRSPEVAQEASQKETADLVKKVSALIKLPDEEPTVATVDDKTKLADQPFFADAENGDKVLIFSAASKAVIYRESENKIINSGPIAITGEQSATSETPVQ